MSSEPTKPLFARSFPDVARSRERDWRRALQKISISKKIDRPLACVDPDGALLSSGLGPPVVILGRKFNQRQSTREGAARQSLQRARRRQCDRQVEAAEHDLPGAAFDGREGGTFRISLTYE